MYGFSGMYGRSYGVTLTQSGMTNTQVQTPGEALIATLARQQRIAALRQDQPVLPPPAMAVPVPTTPTWVYVVGGVAVAGTLAFLARRFIFKKGD